MNIRKATRSDSEGVAEIYNYYVTQTHHTFETDPVSADEMARRTEALADEYPRLVAVDESDRILGFAYASRFKLRQAYEHAAEVSIYVDNDAQKRGTGTRLYNNLFAELVDTHIHTIVAGIALPNDGSVKFHEQLGFEKVAHFKEVGYKLGRWVDVGYWQRLNL